MSFRGLELKKDANKLDRVVVTLKVSEIFESVEDVKFKKIRNILHCVFMKEIWGPYCYLQ